MSNIISICLEMVLVSLQDRCAVCAKHTMAQKSFWSHQMVLLGDEAQVEAHFCRFGDSANLEARYMHGLRRTYHRLRKLFYTHPMELLGDVGHKESHFGQFRDNVCVSAR